MPGQGWRQWRRGPPLRNRDRRLFTCSRITDRGPSATSDEISTPRFIGPGCNHQHAWRGQLQAFAVQAEIAGSMRQSSSDALCAMRSF